MEKSKRGAGIGLLSFDFPSKPTLATFHRHNAREIYRGHRSLPVLSHCVWKTLTSLTVALVSKLSRNRLNSTEREKERERESHPSPSTLFIKIGIATQASWNYTADSSILLPTNSPNYHPRSIREDVLAHVSVKKQEDGSLDEIRNEIKRGTKVCFACHPYSRT